MEGVHHGRSCSNSADEISQLEETMELRRGTWTVEEDVLLMNYIANHGEGRWNLLAQAAGLKRTGKSCRLRWLNYLRPDVRRGNITLEEQLKILELHSRWGNRWSKIAKYLPGRTDNEIKNYWRTRVQKHAKQLRCDVNSKLFKDTMRNVWMPRLVERIQAATAADQAQASSNSGRSYAGTAAGATTQHPDPSQNLTSGQIYTPENSSDSLGTQFSSVNSDLTDSNCHAAALQQQVDHESDQNGYENYPECLTSPCGYVDQGLGFQGGQQSNVWLGSEATWESLWSEEEIWLLQQQLSYGI